MAWVLGNSPGIYSLSKAINCFKKVGDVTRRHGYLMETSMAFLRQVKFLLAREESISNPATILASSIFVKTERVPRKMRMA